MYRRGDEVLRPDGKRGVVREIDSVLPRTLVEWYPVPGEREWVWITTLAAWQHRAVVS